MKKILLPLCLLLGLSNPILPSTATAKCYTTSHDKGNELKDAYKGMLNVITYNEKGNVLHSGYGFFIDDNGTGVAAYALFKDAHKAIVVDYKGNKLSIERIMGASSNYDLVKFRVNKEYASSGFSISADHSAFDTGSKLNLIQYTGKKKATPRTVELLTADPFEDYKYYTISAENIAKNIGCPLTDNEGRIIAIVQENVEDKASNACAIDARFLNLLKIGSTSILNSDLKSINIPKGIPSEESEALTYIYMLGNQDSSTVICAHNDFIESFPDNAEGYSNRASFYASHQEYELCESDFAKALDLADEEESTIKADIVHSNFSKAIFNDIVSNATNESGNTNWSMDKAIEEAEKAYAINPLPSYLLQKGHCLFKKNEFAQAYGIYNQISTGKYSDKTTWSPQAQSEAWLYAARSYELAMKNGQLSSTQNDSLHIITLLDSALTVLPQEYLIQNSNLILEKAQRHEALLQYREAVMEYSKYEKIIGPKNLNDKFYYLREQAELKCHMYQQALDDIRTAKAFNPQDPFYPVEEAVILLQAGMFKDAIAICEQSLKAIPENPDCYKIMGIAYGELKNKKLALQYLKKAQDLGDPTIAPFLQKYQ